MSWGASYQARFGEEIARRRTNAGLSLDDLADAAGVCAETLAAVEAGAVDVELGVIVRLADALGVPPSVLLASLDGSASAGDAPERR